MQRRFGIAAGGSRHREQQMRMAVDKTGHHNAPIGAHLDGLARQRQIFDPPGRTDFNHNAVANQQGAVLDNAKLVEFSPPPRGLGAAKSEKLASSPDEYDGRTFSEMRLPYRLVRSGRLNACGKLQQSPEAVR